MYLFQVVMQYLREKNAHDMHLEGDTGTEWTEARFSQLIFPDKRF